MDSEGLPGVYTLSVTAWSAEEAAEHFRALWQLSTEKVARMLEEAESPVLASTGEQEGG